jgi:23S rRNA pseudouridine2457 synthase|tara:strand:- start:2305 stop:2931 length:627 start_codon:yes stop_codon:yes gene_type:complete
VSKLLLFNKPFHVLSQFTDSEARKTLSEFIQVKGVYPAGRLDYDSEGLLLLTDDGQLQAQISNPKYKLNKTYWAQVEGSATEAQCLELIEGVSLKDGPASAVSCRLMDPPNLWPRVPPIRERQSVADSWIELTINEGRNRQVRRMTAAVGLPTLRLVRAAIGDWKVTDISPGEFLVETVATPAVKKPVSKRPASKRAGNKKPLVKRRT